MFTDDVALMLNDVEIYNLATAYDLHCGIVINPGAYSISASVTFAFQKDFALTEAIDHQLKAGEYFCKVGHSDFQVHCE